MSGDARPKGPRWEAVRARMPFPPRGFANEAEPPRRCRSLSFSRPCRRSCGDVPGSDTQPTMPALQEASVDPP
eukprot:1566552-Pyramimonas_sp.AAC.1